MKQEIKIDCGAVVVARVKNQTLLDALLDMELIDVREHVDLS